jgi:hypothetical protein
VYSRRDRAKVRKTFSEHWEAKAWRHEQLELASIDRLRTPSRLSLAETSSLWVEMAQKGQIRNRSGRRYKPSTLRTIEADLRLHLVPGLGAKVMVGVTCGPATARGRLACQGIESKQDPFDRQRRTGAMARY